MLTLILLAGKDSGKILDYFSRNGAPCPPDANPAEHIIEVVQGGTTQQIDWVDIWNQSPERKQALEELESLNAAGLDNPDYVEDTANYATSHWYQFKLVAKRLSIQIWRSPVSLPVGHFGDKMCPLTLPRIICGTR
jgi:hypothetical protein